MAISVLRSTVARELGNEIPRPYLIVTAPDHPLLVEGPDLLIGGEGSLVAVCTPKASERTMPSSLAVRFILSRLALPPRTAYVLLWPDHQDDATNKYNPRNFGAVLPWHRRRELAKIVKDKNFAASRRALPVEIIDFVRQRFSDVYEVTYALKRRTLRHRTLEDYEITSRREPTVRREMERVVFLPPTPWSIGVLYEFPEVVPGVKSAQFYDQPVTSADIQDLVRHSTLSAFSVDDGVPYPKEDACGLAVVQQLPEYRSDPNKFVRAAAFAGWAFVEQSYEGQLEKIARLLSRRRENRARPWASKQDE